MTEVEVSGAVETWLAQSAASLSLFGGIIVVLCILLNRDMRKEILAIKYIFFLTLSDLLLAVGYLLQNHCQLQARFLQYFSVSSFLWSAIFSHYLFAKRGALTDPDYISKHVDIDPLTKPSRRDIVYHLIAWGVPLIFTLILHEQDEFGSAGTWCWISDAHQSRRLLFFYLPLLIVCVWNSVMLFLFYRVVSNTASADSTPVHVHRNLSLYVIATLFVWCFGLIRRLHEMVTGDDPVVLACLQSFMTPLHGFVNTLVYTFSLKAFQRAIKARLRSSKPAVRLDGDRVEPRDHGQVRAVSSGSTASTSSRGSGADAEYIDDEDGEYEVDPATGQRVYKDAFVAYHATSPDDARRAAAAAAYPANDLEKPLLGDSPADSELKGPKAEGPDAAKEKKELTKRDKLMAGVSFAGLCLFRGILPVAQKKAGDSFSPMMGNALRSSFGGLMYVVTLLSIRLFLQLHNGLEPKTRESWDKQVAWGIEPGLFLKIFLIAVFQSQGPVLLISYSVRFIPSGLSAALISTTPLFTLLIQKIIHSLRPGLIPQKDQDEPKTGWHRYAVLIGVMIGLAGAALVCIPQMIVQARRSAADLSMAGVGILMSTGAAISIAGAGIYMSNFVKQPSAMVKACYAALCGGTLLLVLSCATEVWRMDPFGHGIQAWGWVLLLAATSSYSSNFLNFYLLDTAGALFTSFVWYIVPVVGIFIGAVFESEWSDYSPTLIALQCLGCVVIWAGLGLTSAPQFAKKKEVPNSSA